MFLMICGAICLFLAFILYCVGKADDRSIIPMIFSLIFAVVGTFTFDYGVNSLACSSKWQNSGMSYQYGYLSGCRIKANDKWIPAENYREM